MRPDADRCAQPGKLRRAATAIVGLVVLGSTIVGCSGSSTDREIYSSVADLAAQAELVVHATVGTSRESKISGGTTVTFFNVESPEALAGELPAAPLIVTSYEGEGGPSLVEGDDVVLFLEHVTSAEVDGSSGETSWYDVVGGDQGVFDIDGTEAKSRSDPRVTLEPSTLAALTSAVSFAAG